MDNLKTYRILIAALCAGYVAMRLWRLTDACLWFDEIFGMHAAEHSWGGMWWFVAQDLIHPPFSYALLKVWIGFGGDGLLWLRLFPVFFAAMALVPFLFLCRELKLKTSTTLIALALFAVNGSLIKYAQEVRMYSLLLCLSLFSIWLFTRFLNRGKNIWILTAVNVLLIHTHYFGWFVVASEVLIILIMQRIKLRHMLTMLGILTISYVPWLIAIWRAAAGGSDVRQNIAWIGQPGFREVLDLIFDLVEPFYFQISSVDPRTLLWLSLPMTIVFIIAKTAYLGDKNDEDRERMVLLSIFIGLPVTAAFLISWLSPYSVWGSRHLIVIFAPVTILFAIYLSEIRAAVLRNVLLGAIGIVTVAAFVRTAVNSPQEQIWCAWGKLASELPADEPQTVFVFEDLTAYHLWFATREQGNVSVVKLDGLPGMVEDKAYFLPRGFDSVRRTGIESIASDRFWIAFRDMRWDERHPPLSQLLSDGYRLSPIKPVEAAGVKAYLVEVTR